MVTFSKKAAVSLGLTFLIFIIIALVILLALSSAIRNYLLGGLNYFWDVITQTTNSGTNSTSIGTARSSFVAFSCKPGDTPECAKFPADMGTWFVDYNGQNSSANLSASIGFTVAQGNYSFVAYDINYTGNLYCNNQSYPETGGVPHAGYLAAGDVKIIYYFSEDYLGSVHNLKC